MADLKTLAEQANENLADASAYEILQWARETFGDELVVTASMADGALPHLAAQAAPGVDVVFLDTGYHFVETIGTRDAVGATLDINLVNVTPEQTVAEQDATYGKDLFARDPDKCCALRKVAPLNKALSGYTAWVTGVRREESPTRSNTPVVEYDAKRNMVKLNPIAPWTQDDLDTFIADNGVLVNPLVYDGYPSIGCEPCTRRVAPGEDPRSGRWAGRAKTECGLHV
ncbi:MAG TPA: phosphoadenylyl-sulfate reductase [Kribbellaceae bacterium]|nr:phosphoadenylyl-sulfate reductase [Kribbellaceae bacterium]